MLILKSTSRRLEAERKLLRLNAKNNQIALS